jgi:hypothetical protein
LPTIAMDGLTPLPNGRQPGCPPAREFASVSVLFLGLLESLGFFPFLRRLGRRLLDVLLCVLALAHGMLSVVESHRSASDVGRQLHAPKSAGDDAIDDAW